MNLLRLFAAFFRVNFLGETAYRINFVWQLFQSVLSLGMSLTGIAVIFTYTHAIGGWQPNEVLALVGVYLLVGGIIGLVIQPAMQAFIESVRDGSLDFVITKPEDIQLLVSIRRVEIWQFIDMALGVAVLVTALVRLGANIGLAQAGTFLLMLAIGAVIIYSFFFILATLSFWFVRVENILNIFQSMYEAGRWPISLYPGWLRYGLTFVIPVAFAVTVPAEALTGRLNWPTMLGAAILAAGLFVVSRAFWKLGLRRYSSASS